MHKKLGVKSLVAKGIDLCWVLALQSSVDWLFLPLWENLWISEVMVFVQSWWGIVTNAPKMRWEKFRCKRNWSWLGFGLAKFGGLAFFALVQNWWISEVMVFVQSWWGIVTNAPKMRCEKFGCKRNWSWLGFGFAKFGGLTFFSLVPNLVNKWSYGFCAIMAGNCHKWIKNEVWKVWLQRNWSWLGFGLAKFGGLAFFAFVAKLVNKWSYGFSAILVANCHKCIKNEVWKVWLQKELILVGFWLSQVWWICFFCLGSKIGE